jgi:hypothetical protein
MPCRDHQRVFCVLRTTPTLKFTRTKQYLNLFHLLLQFYVVLEMFSKKLRMESHAPLELHVPDHFLKLTVINLSRNSPPIA